MLRIKYENRIAYSYCISAIIACAAVPATHLTLFLPIFQPLEWSCSYCNSKCMLRQVGHACIRFAFRGSQSRTHTKPRCLPLPTKKEKDGSNSGVEVSKRDGNTRVNGLRRPASTTPSLAPSYGGRLATDGRPPDRRQSMSASVVCVISLMNKCERPPNKHLCPKTIRKEKKKESSRGVFVRIRWARSRPRPGATFKLSPLLYSGFLGVVRKLNRADKAMK